MSFTEETFFIHNSKLSHSGGRFAAVVAGLQVPAYFKPCKTFYSELGLTGSSAHTLSSSVSSANNRVLFLLSLPGEVFIQHLCLPLLFFFLTFICRLHGIDSQTPVCCLCEQHTSWREGKRGRWTGPISPSRTFAHSSLEGGFPRFTPLSFWTRTKRICGHKRTGFQSGWFGWRMLRRRVAFNPQNQFASSKPHCAKWKHTLRGLAPDTGEK